MTRAHISSRLSVRNASPVLPEGMILFPLDGRVIDTLDSIPVSVNITTFNDYDKKFFTSVGVEDPTTNLITNYAVHMNKSNYAGTTTDVTNRYKFTKTTLIEFKPRTDPTAVGWQVAQVTLPSTWDTTVKHTVSFYVRSNTPELGNLSISIRNGNGLEVAMQTVSYAPTTEWTRFTATFTPAIASSGGQVIYIGANENHSFEIADPQLEKLDHATSFVVGSRPWGCLRYDISSLLMRDAGCISCWIYTSDTMVNYKANGTGGSANNQYLIKVGSDPNDGYKDNLTIRLPGGGSRTITVFTSPNAGSQGVITATTKITDLGIGTWNHYVMQWDKNSLPTGNAYELYVNGKLEAGTTSSATLPVNYINHIHLGNWVDQVALMPVTFFEQLAIHPSKGFAPDVIESWYTSNAPFFDFRDSIGFI